MPPYNSSLPYSVYTDKSCDGGGGASEGLAQTLINGNNAGLNPIDMTNQNILNCNNLDAANVDVTNTVDVGFGGIPNIVLDGLTGFVISNDISCNDITCNDITSTGTLTYNLLNPAIPSFQPSSFAFNGNFGATSFGSSVGYPFSSMSFVSSFSEAPPLPSPQPNLNTATGVYANGLAGWYRMSLLAFPVLPAFNYFITINIGLSIFNNATGTAPPINTYFFEQSQNANNLTTFVVNNSMVVELQLGQSVQWNFNCTTQGGVTYQMLYTTQMSGELVSQG